ncbi:hypothetical protein [Flavobacterium sp. SM2513]|uniref:hypothetical protein n=1 Tax=Flavobacterium sp. SM2513 TaxID=3424766 RepID=UPI003D7F6AA8
MKKIVLAFNMLALVALVSCKKDTPPPPPPAPEPQVIVAPPPPPPTKAEESDGTSISVGSDGVEVSTKDGTKKTDINVKDGKGSIEIKK